MNYTFVAVILFSNQINHYVWSKDHTFRKRNKYFTNVYFLQVIEEFGGDDGEGAQNSLPQSRECKVEQKKFYFDVGRNDRGVFLRLTEVTYCRESSKLF